MPTSTFHIIGAQFIDAINPTFAPAWLFDVGTAYIGPSKSFVRRGLARFDVFGLASEGRSLNAADVILDAELLLDAIGVVGAAGAPARVERISRGDWDYATANWNVYRTGASWTAGGGDVATPPPAVTFGTPGALGAFVVGGMAAFVTDAVANRAGAVLLRMKLDGEAPPSSQWFSVNAAQTHALRMRLRVTYQSAEPTPIAEPGTSVGSARPDGSASPSGIAAPARADAPSAPDTPRRN
jgi:hypothetical protein